MYNTVKIGERMVPMMAMASCDVYYRNIFHEDAIKLQTKKDLDEGDLVNFIMKMGFVMAKFYELKADRKEMAKLNEDAYLDWLEQFEMMDMMTSFTDILDLWNIENLTHATAKKKNGRSTGK